MSTVVVKLFDSVLSKLGPEKALDWPKINVPDEGRDPVDEPGNTDDDGIFSIDEVGRVNRVSDHLAGRHVSGDLNDSEAEAIEGGIRQRGFDALAFYKSCRIASARPFPGLWGIFYLKEGLVYIESQIAREYPGYGNPRKLALGLLREHERFHYRADLQTLMFEATLGRSLYLPLRRALRGQRSHFIEEALANRQAWDWSKKGSVGIQEFAFDFMKLQPNAYACFDKPRLRLAAEWAGTVVDQLPPGTVHRPDLAHWVETSPAGLLRASLCPEYVIYPGRLSSWLDPALVLPTVASVEDGDEVSKILKKRFAHLRDKWAATKTKLVENRLLRGLNFKPWPKDGPAHYSVRVDDNFRAHLQHLGDGRWVAYVLGRHADLGHG